MEIKEIVEQTFEKFKTFNPIGIMPAFRKANEGAVEDFLNTNGNAYYQWDMCLSEVINPKQIVELGGAMGIWDIAMLYQIPKETQLYSITLAEYGLEFSYIADNYPNFHPIIGDDLDIKNWKGVDLTKTDLWFFDSLHTHDQLEKELKLYTPFFHKGTILLFDDIHMPELEDIWDKLIYPKWDLTDPCHYSGYGIVQYV
jgi:hypothetical protein